MGVVKDLHFASMKNKIEPSIFYLKKWPNALVYVKTTGKDAGKAIAAAEKVWKEYNADLPFRYTFMDEAFNSLYENETRTSTIFNIFAVIAIVICCLGLLGACHVYSTGTHPRDRYPEGIGSECKRHYPFTRQGFHYTCARGYRYRRSGCLVRDEQLVAGFCLQSQYRLGGIPGRRRHRHPDSPCYHQFPIY